VLVSVGLITSSLQDGDLVAAVNDESGSVSYGALLADMDVELLSQESQTSVCDALLKDKNIFTDPSSVPQLDSRSATTARQVCACLPLIYL
jgi:hypothetical protein